ncbi:hypothetical protein QZH41_017140, partial [Actinostola sp. cb2023]
AAEYIQLQPDTIASSVAGIVQVYHNGQWGTVCTWGWGKEETKVACRQLGFSKAVGYLEGRGKGKQWLESLGCSGSETSLHNCQHSGWGNTNPWCKAFRTHFGISDVGVVCSGYKGPSANNIRLEPRTTRAGVAGMLQVYNHGQLGPVCDDGWDYRETRVACRQLGFAKAHGSFKSWQKASGGKWMRFMECTGSEDSLLSCPHSYSGLFCDSIGVMCSGYQEDTEYVKFQPDTILTESVSGIVRIYRNGTWGTVCKQGWNMDNTEVACRQLGFAKAVGHWEGQGTGKHRLYSMKCSGSEASLQNCSAYDRRLAFHFRFGCERRHRFMPDIDVGVVCSGYRGPSADDIQLEPKTRDSGVAGMIQVYHHGQLGTVCTWGWEKENTKVACRQLGFSKAVTYFHNGSRQTSKMSLSRVRCSGSEASLLRCSHSYQSCHTPSLGVVCSGSGHSNLKFRFQSDHQSTNRLQVQYYGVWGDVCASSLHSMNEAHVICRSLNNQKAMTVSPWAKKADISFALSMTCNGTEVSTAECRELSVNQVVMCDNNEIVQLSCL